jgi:hypothetical protein
MLASHSAVVDIWNQEDPYVLIFKLQSRVNLLISLWRDGDRQIVKSHQT